MAYDTPRPTSVTPAARPAAGGIVIPPELLPADGRFGSGPSKVRPEAVAALSSAAPAYLGTSHRRDPFRALVGRLREGLRTLFSLPDDYEVVLGVGGATAFWDAMAFGLIERRSQHVVFGEFSAKCAGAVAAAAHLDDPVVVESEPGTKPHPIATSGVDLYALTQNETSTGVAAPVTRPSGDGLTAVDATSAAGGMLVDPLEFDVYYFSPQKCFASDGGLWIALCSPAALERVERLAAARSFIPPSLSLMAAVTDSRRNQTYNTPGLATLFLMVEQLDWMLDSGGLEWAARRCHRSSQILYGWAESSAVARPFVGDSKDRSPVVVTIDFAEAVDARSVAATLRSNGILDTEPYRKLGRNQLRIACYPAVEPADVEALTRCIDFVLNDQTSR
jgi:phosphoserine aminotransferase